MVIIPWDGRNYHEKSDLTKGNHFTEMEYFNRGVFTQGTLSAWCVTMGNYIHRDVLSANEVAHVHNKCVTKIVDQAQVVENYFEAIYERREALELAANAAKKLLDFILNFKRPQYWKSIGKPKPKDLPEAWLTYNFGISPLIATIDSAMNLLGKPYPSIILKGGSGLPVDAIRIDENPWTKDVHSAKGTYFKQIRAHVKPHSNPNAALANVVGLSTPFSTAFSVVPWGWAVDYFVNCSDLMSNFEDRFPGIYFESIWESVSFKAEIKSARYDKDAKEYTDVHYGTMFNTWRRRSSLNYSLEFSFPLLGGSKFANLASAIALTLKGK